MKIISCNGASVSRAWNDIAVFVTFELWEARDLGCGQHRLVPQSLAGPDGRPPGRCSDSVTRREVPPSFAMLLATQGDHHTCPPTGDPQDRRAALSAAEAGFGGPGFTLGI